MIISGCCNAQLISFFRTCKQKNSPIFAKANLAAKRDIFITHGKSVRPKKRSTSVNHVNTSLNLFMEF